MNLTLLLTGFITPTGHDTSHPEKLVLIFECSLVILVLKTKEVGGCFLYSSQSFFSLNNLVEIDISCHEILE